MFAIYKRESNSYFQTPIGYIVVAVLYFFLGLFFTIIYSQGSPEIASVITSLSTIAIFIIPILTMRLMSEDRRQKVDQALLTAPVSLTSIVLGKFFAAFGVFSMGLVPAIVFEGIIMSYVSVNPFEFAYAYLGIQLLAAVLIAIGMFISSLTESSVVAGILTLVINILISYMSGLSNMVSQKWLVAILDKLAIMTAFENFSTNYFSIENIIYFVSITAIFIFLSVRSLERRRWS